MSPELGWRVASAVWAPRRAGQAAPTLEDSHLGGQRRPDSRKTADWTPCRGQMGVKFRPCSWERAVRPG